MLIIINEGSPLVVIKAISQVRKRHNTEKQLSQLQEVKGKLQQFLVKLEALDIFFIKLF